MKAAWYEKQGPARDVLIVGELPDPHPGPGEVRIRVAASGINRGDVKKRGDTFGLGMPFPRVIPHSDGAGQVDEIGDAVSPEWLGQSVWCYGAQSYRAFGTAAEFTVVPATRIAPLPKGIPPEQGACLGIPGITGHRAATTLLPGVLWFMAANKNRITRETVDQAALVADIQIPEEYKEMLVERLNRVKDDFAALRELHLPNHVPSALVFDPVVPGTQLESIRRPASSPPLEVQELLLLRKTWTI